MVRTRSSVRETLLEKAKKLIQFSEDGQTEFLFDLDRLTQAEKIEIYLTSRWFAHEGGLAGSDAASHSELVDALGIPLGSVQGRTSDLASSGALEKVGDATYRIRYTKIGGVLDRVLEKLKT
jgi:hypothetical protein